MTRPGNHNNPHLYPGHHNLVQSNPCEHVICGPNEVCVEGCCVCIAGYTKDKNGKCVPLDEVPLPKPDSQNAILQETTGLIFTETDFIINYDPVDNSSPGLPIDPCKGVSCSSGFYCYNGVCIPDPNYNPCAGVFCGPNEICSKGLCIPDPNYNPCLGVYCDPGYYCVNGFCVRNTQSTAVLQESEGLVLTEAQNVINYD